MVSTGGSAILWPWVWPAVVILAAVVAGVAWWRARRLRPASAGDTVWVANTAHLAQVPAIRRRLRRYRRLQAAGALALVVGVVGAGAVAARPVHTDIVVDRMGSRDIVLCLDVSGSMIPYDGAVLRVFEQMVADFRGERIGLSIFNSTSRTVFPLTDDYTLVRAELEAGIAALARDPQDFDFDSGRDDAQILKFAQFTAGTRANEKGASLIGDGLATCALQFDQAESERSRSIILATDNYVAGEPIYTLDQAAALVDSRGIRLNGIFGGSELYRNTPEELAYRKVVQQAGGLYFLADDPAAVETMVADVVSRQAVELDAQPEVLVTDRPRLWFLVTAAGLAGLLLLAWRVRQ